MDRYKINNIIKLANLFEKSLIKLAQKMKFTAENLVDLLPGIGTVEFDLPIEDVNQWLQINKNNLSLVNNYTWRQEFDDKSEQYFLLGTNSGLGDEAHITTSNVEPEFMKDIKINNFLKGYKSIPNMWYWQGTYSEEGVNPLLISKDLSHNYYLVEAINQLFGLDLENPSHISMLEKFYKDNESKIKNIRKNFSMNPKKLGSGIDGVAFKINSFQVLKIFKSEHVFKDALESINRLHQSPEVAGTEANIYDAGVLGNILNNTLYYYIIEYMSPVSKIGLDTDPVSATEATEFLNKNIIKYITHIMTGFFPEIQATWSNRSFWRDIKNKMATNQISNAEVRNILKKSSEEMSDYILLSVDNSKLQKFLNFYEKNNFNLSDKWLQLLIEEIIFKYLTNRVDFHLGNIGLVTSPTEAGEDQKFNFRYFDPSHESRQTFNIKNVEFV
jgi:hypothetical protein